MLMSRYKTGAALGLFVVVSTWLLSGCMDAPQPIAGTDLATVRLHINDDQMGVHPNQSVLVNPHNPFKDLGVGEETKWELLSYANRSAAFYAWATLLA